MSISCFVHVPRLLQIINIPLGKLLLRLNGYYSVVFVCVMCSNVCIDRSHVANQKKMHTQKKKAVHRLFSHATLGMLAKSQISIN